MYGLLLNVSIIIYGFSIGFDFDLTPVATDARCSCYVYFWMLLHYPEPISFDVCCRIGFQLLHLI